MRKKIEIKTKKKDRRRWDRPAVTECVTRLSRNSRKKENFSSF
jgi:hypothetical protein